MGKTTETSTTSFTSDAPFHAFVRQTKGYRKVRYGGVCEDAAKLIRLKRGIIAAVADGHGDPSCAYADLGSAFAVEAACRVLREIYDEKDRSELCDFCAASRDEIAQKIILLWNELVLDDYLKKPEGDPLLSERDSLVSYITTAFNPPAQQELSVDQTRAYYAKRDRIAKLRNDVAILYGTTLKALFETDEFVLCLSIGDGDVVAVEGDRVTWLCPKDDQYSTATDSLCFPPQKAQKCFCHVLIRKREPGNTPVPIGFGPDYILLSTDGFRNSFPSDRHFEDCLVSLGRQKASGFRKMKRECTGWIERLSMDSFCGDDITLCIVY